MDPNSGRIYDNRMMKELFDEEEQKNLVPFEVGEIIELKDCRFKVRSIFPHPQNIVTLEGIPKEKKS